MYMDNMINGKFGWYRLYMNRYPVVKTVMFLSIFIATPFLTNKTFAGESTYTTSGTWVAPSGVTQVTVQAIGGGGGGGTGDVYYGSPGGGGGGGGEFRSSVISVTSGTSYSVVVGSGGAGSSSGYGDNGGASTFNTTSVVANGGYGGGPQSEEGRGGGGGWGGTGTVGYGGGSGADAYYIGFNYNGGGGGEGASSTSNGTTAVDITGASGTDGGDGGNGGGTIGSGYQGQLYGGGGGGGGGAMGTNTVGGDGADGQVILSWSEPPAGVDLSGIIYQSDGTSAYNCSTNNLTLNIVVSGSGTYPATCTSSSGSWAVTGITASSGNTVFIYIDGETPKANTVLISNGSNQTNVNIIQDRILLRDDANGTITNSEISSGNTSDSDDLISFSGSNITSGSSYTTHIYTGDTYAPGADVTTGKLLVVGNYSGSTETLTLTGSGTSTSRPLYINGGTFTAPSNVAYQGSSATTIEETPYINLSFTPTITGATSYTFLGSGSVSGNLTINPTAASSYALTVNLGGTLTIAPSGTLTITGTTSGLSTLDTVSSSNHTISAGKIDIQSAGTLTANSSNIYLTGTSGTIFTRTGTFTYGQSEVFFQQSSGGTTLTSGETTFHGLTVNMPGQTGSVGNNVTVVNDLYVGAGELSIPSTYALSITGVTDISGSLTISSSGNQTLESMIINSGGTFTRSNSSGTNILNGQLEIYGGGTFTTSNNPAFTLRGGLSNSGTFTSGNGTYTFDTNSQSLEGSGAINFGGNVSISGGITLQNSNTNTVTVTGNLIGSLSNSTYQNNTNATTNFKGTVLSTGTLTATADSNSIYYTSSSAQNVKATTYHDLHLTPTITGAYGLHLFGRY